MKTHQEKSRNGIKNYAGKRHNLGNQSLDWYTCRLTGMNHIARTATNH
jgi:hypothetical protein